MSAHSITIPPPAQGASSKERFEQLGQAVGLSEAVVKYMYEASPNGLQFDTEQDLLYGFDGTPWQLTEGSVKHCIVEESARPRETARLARLWHALNDQSDAAQRAKVKALETAEMDTLLDAPVLEDLEDKVYMRYKVTYPAEVAPADIVTSRCQHEIDKRSVQVKDLRGMKTMA